MTGLDDLWRKYAAAVPGLLDRRPDFRFDPRHYGAHVPDVPQVFDTLHRHYVDHGKAQGLHPTLFHQLHSAQPAINKVLLDLVVDPDLRRLMEEDLHEAYMLCCELIHLGAPVDSTVSDFSLEHYLEMNHDIARVKMNPLLHYLLYGANEGRKSLAQLRRSQSSGKSRYHAGRQTCLIVVHEFSRTGAPIVGVDLVREAARTHNVIVCGLRGGDLFDQFREHACEVVVTNDPFADFKYYTGEIFQKIDFAITNSVESFPCIKFLVSNDIPFAAYIHEYTEYTFPAYKLIYTALFSDLVVFSSDHVRDSWTGCMKDVEFDVVRDSTIIPQRDLVIGGVSADEIAEARQRLSAMVGRDLTNVKLICGAGHLQWRKGTDIFAMTAQICRDDAVFLWIGDGLNFEDTNFGAWMSYHLKMIGTGLPDSNLFLLPAGPAYPDVLAASDGMYVSSRLDPLPNVVFDAVDAGCRIVMFEGATGFGDQRYQTSDTLCSVEYGNPVAAAQAIRDLPRKEGATKRTQPPRARLFAQIHKALEDRLAAQRYFVRGASEIDVPMLYSSEERHRALRVREREKTLRYGRKLVWRDLDEVREELAASDNWVHRNLRLAPYGVAETAQIPDFSMHIHAYYTDDLAEDVSSYRAYHHANRILVTTDTEKKADEITRIMQAEGLTPEILLIGNRGRDILPFMELFLEGGAAGDDEIWCHLHQKKSLSTSDRGDVWRQFLMRILLGDAERVSSSVTMMAQEDVGFVAPFDPFFIPWNASRGLLPRFASRLPGPMPENPLLFPVGNMFWVRRSVVLAMNDVFGQNYPWPNEPIANDGTEFHLIERLWPAMTTHVGMNSIFMHKLDQLRV